MNHREGPIFTEPDDMKSVFSGFENLLQRSEQMPPLLTAEDLELIASFKEFVKNKYPSWYESSLKDQSDEDVLELAKSFNIPTFEEDA